MSKRTRKYTLELLQCIVDRDKCKLIGQYHSVSARTTIHYVCGEIDCDAQHNKTFQNVVLAGAFCRQCCMKKRLNKIKRTCLRKYGVANPFQSDSIKDKIKNTCLKKYGVEHVGQSKEVIEKASQTNMLRYGARNVFQSETIKKRIKSSLLKRYGVTNPQKSKVINEKTKQTCLSKYNAENPMQNEEVRNKGKKTNLVRYGVENTFQSDVIKDKIRRKVFETHGVEHNAQRPDVLQAKEQTCMQRYGCRNHMQNPEVFERYMQKAYKTKEYMFTDGTKVEVQGYEPWALQLLEFAGYCSNDIVVQKQQVPSIWYDINGKKKRYYCDLYIPEERIVVEVKSTYTYKCDIVKLMKVHIECDKLKLKFCLLVFDDKGVLDLQKCIF